ncbi:hypothetical protein SEVIR_9G480400v4 [Setaria viridis]|uniref:Uncharacterized protein n=1 Tax=Setaria viridis TaxID=4556 RepID=A0A4U6T8V6_SETVI|nr:transcription factor MYB1-like [Setaria viridis]TKV97223.1 hypothetical protein SEVIR_9G480400v2 [Setaria viridis]
MAVPNEAAVVVGVQPVPAAATKKPAWTKDEDAALREQVRAHGPQNWAAISAALPGRNPKSCRLRWCQHLTPGVDPARPFSPEEDEKIAHFHRLYPNKWATIAGFLPGRSDNAIKNRWNSVLGKQQPQHHQQQRAAAVPFLGLSDGTLPLFPLTSGDVRVFGRSVPVLRRPPPGDAGVDLSGACLKLFPLATGDLVGGNDSGEAAEMDVDCSADDQTVTEMTLWPSTMAAFKAMVQAVRAP